MSAQCCICGEAASARTVKLRSGKSMTLWHCGPCDFDFFAHDPTGDLAANKLDESRLKAAGLDIPAVERDFENGLAQSRTYVSEYIEAADQGGNVLEIGCSWGYFLKLAAAAGMKPYGVEINTTRSAYVNEKLGIPCDATLEACEARGLKFRKVFLFYVLEYIPNPVAYLKRLVHMLEPGGMLVMVTPNLDDVLKDLWRNEAFGNFFYEERAINYMTVRTVDRLLERVQGVLPEVSSRQGYSVANHMSWFLTNAPRTTGVVGGDNFLRGMLERLRPASALADPDERRDALASKLADLLVAFDREYRRVIEGARYGNQIRIIARK